MKTKEIKCPVIHLHNGELTPSDHHKTLNSFLISAHHTHEDQFKDRLPLMFHTAAPLVQSSLPYTYRGVIHFSVQKPTNKQKSHLTCEHKCFQENRTPFHFRP